MNEFDQITTEAITATSIGTLPVEMLPRWEQNLMRKHEEQIHQHETQFGKLGELQTQEQKEALNNAVALLALREKLIGQPVADDEDDEDYEARDYDNYNYGAEV